MMDLQTLLEGLQAEDADTRIETLRIIAMVEETEAIAALTLVFKSDPDPRVRKVAQWAGRLVWQARQRGHSTEQALRALYDGGLSADHEELFLDALAAGMTEAKSEQEAQALRQQARLKREMLDTLHDRSAHGQDISLSDLASDLLDELE